MKKLDLAAIPAENGANYPAPFDRPCIGQTYQRVGAAGGLTKVGVNISRLPPGVWSSQRHWHSHEDEFVYVLEGELVSITDEGEEVLGPGDCIGFKAGDADGHHLVNRSSRDALVLEIGTRDPEHDRCVYPDIDMIAEPKVEPFLHRTGEAYPLNKPSTWLVGQAP